MSGITKKRTTKPIEKTIDNTVETNQEEMYDSKPYNYKNISGSEDIYFNDLMNINFEATQDYDLYKSKIIIGNKTFEIRVKFNVGRKVTTPLHAIVTHQGQRQSLGFATHYNQLRDYINQYIERYYNG